MELRLSKRSSQAKASEIREILKVTERPEVISFAGGLPAPESFPIEEIREICDTLMKDEGEKALQYGTTEGYTPLRKQIAGMLNKLGIEASGSDILVTAGSQQGLDLTGKVFIDEGDIIICESPTYLAAINAFKTYMPLFVDTAMDDDGMKIDELENNIKKYPTAKFIYTIPDFQNPSGRMLSLERRKKIIELANKHDMIIIEDNPYGELVFEGESLPPIKHFDTEGRVVYMSTFSKILSPGLRVGFILASPDILQKYILFKQSTDLHTNMLSQMLTSRFLDKFDLEQHIAKIRSLYKQRCELMYTELISKLPEGIKCSRPKGGLFLWLELPEHLNAREVLKMCMEQNVAFVPGGSFFPNGGKENTMRLNFSNMQEGRIVEGISRLTNVLKKLI